MPEGYGWVKPGWSVKRHVSGPDGHVLCGQGPAAAPGSDRVVPERRTKDDCRTCFRDATELLPPSLPPPA
jgi:hypothetical protein